MEQLSHLHMCTFNKDACMYIPPVFAALAKAVVMGPGAIVVVASIVVISGAVAMVMRPGVHGRALPKNVTSARCTQSETPGKNSRVTNGSLMLIGMHTLTREAQEVF